jgi:hypothetical protein
MRADDDLILLKNGFESFSVVFPPVIRKHFGQYLEDDDLIELQFSPVRPQSFSGRIGKHSDTAEFGRKLLFHPVVRFGRKSVAILIIQGKIYFDQMHFLPSMIFCQSTEDPSFSTIDPEANILRNTNPDCAPDLTHLRSRGSAFSKRVWMQICRLRLTGELYDIAESRVSLLDALVTCADRDGKHAPTIPDQIASQLAAQNSH